jgi:uncharacterized protein YlzI (FlbEa/FlbD family)
MNFIKIKDDGDTRLINISQIESIRSAGPSRCDIEMISGSKYFTQYSLKEINEKINISVSLGKI